MLRQSLAFRRSALVHGAGLLTGVALTGCAGVQPTRTVTAAATNSAPDSTTDSTTASATSSSASSSEESTPPDSPLTAGLLSAADLGASDVHQFPLDGSGSADATDHPGPWGWGWGGGRVTPR